MTRRTTEPDSTADTVDGLKHDLRKRIRELDCLYGVSRLVATSGTSLEQTFQGIADLLPSGWQYPEVACARIVIEDREFKTENFRATPWRQMCNVEPHGERIGRVEVCYLEEKPDSDEGPFLKEERSLINAIAERLGRIVERRRAEGALRKRIKELNCLYDISKLRDTPGISLEQILQGTADLLPPSWEYPEIACARIVLQDQEFKTENFRETPWRQVSDIKAHGEPIGGVEVCYLEERPESDEGPFLEEERDLIDAVAERLGRIVERMRAEEALRERTRDLDKRVKELDCLYGLANLRATPGIPLEQIFGWIADLLPPAWQYPEIACARIVLEDQEFKTENFEETPSRQVSDIKARGERIGYVEVCYLEARPQSDEGPFLKGERSLIDAVAERLGRIVERMRAEEALRERTRQLVDMSGISLEQMLQRVADLIPQSWRYPEVACARIVLEDQEFKTKNFRETSWRQVSNIRLRGERIGSVEVCYLEERPESDEGPFLTEERSLISAVAERLSRIVEVKRAEEKVQAEQQRLAVLVDTSPVGVFVVEAESGRVSFLNREARRILGFPGEPEGRMEWREPVAVYRRPDGRAYAVEELPTVRALYRGESVSAEEVLVEFADGRTIPTLVNATPVYSSDRKVRGAITVIQDITPLEEAEKLRSEFLGMVSHELRTPLTAIKGAAATVLGSPTPLGAQETRELFQVIDEQADRLRDLVSNLLDMTRIEAGRLSVSAAPTDLRAILDEARGTFMRSGGLHELKIELPDDLPAVNADFGRIVQVLVNLLANAARLSPPTAPIVVEVEHDAVSATVHVRDQGRGIVKEKLHLLFKKFAHLHEDEGRKLSGSGLGLAICKGIVEAHGGRIWAESAGEGQGATFSFTLPIASEARVTALSDAARGAVHMRKVARRGERTRVLAMDDEPQVLRYFQRTLNEAGYEAIVTGDPSQVAKLVELEEPDLILLDLIIPGTSGFELLRQIREFSNVPVIIVTASEREEDPVKALKMGADDYITKPFSPSELFARMEVALRRRVSPELLEERPPLVLGDLRINFVERRVTVGGQPISLSATEYKLLYELATHAGRVLTHDQLLERVWGSEYQGETGLLRSFVVLVRRKLGDDARRPRFIFTEPGVGYRMARP